MNKLSNIQMPLLALLIAGAMLYGCRESHPLTADELIDKTYAASGCNKAEKATIKFDFRDRSYEVTRNKGLFEMLRFTFISEDSVYTDKYHNYGFQRFLNDSMVSITDTMATKYQASINSVFYFFSLPMGLKDPAVNASLLGEVQVDGTAYYKLKIWFDETGGGEDHDDIYIYWINKSSYLVDFFAYSYKTDGGGMRFRKAINPRIISGIRVVDYLNYAPNDATTEVASLDQAYMEGSLSLVSEIVNDNVSISLIKE